MTVHLAQRKVNSSDTIRERVYEVLAGVEMETACNEEADIQLLLDNHPDDIPEDFKTPESVVEMLMPQCLAGRINARLSSYFAVHALLELHNEIPSLAGAEEQVRFAEECKRAETNNHFAEKERQRNRASNRRPDALRELIIEMLSGNLNQSWRDIHRSLEKQVGNGILLTVNDEIIEWTSREDRITDMLIEEPGDEEPGDPVKSIPITALKDRVSRAKIELRGK